MSDAKPVRRWTKSVLRILGGALIGIVVLCGIGLLLLATGWPQRKIVEMALTRQVNAVVEVGNVSIWGGVKISELKAFAKAPAGAKGAQILGISRLELGYTLLPKDKRYFSSLAISRLQARLPFPAVPRAPGGETKPMKGKKKTDMLPFIPRDIEIGNISIEDTAGPVGVAIDGLRLTGKVNSSNDFVAELDGSHLEGSWWVASREAARPITDGTLDVRYQKKGGETVVERLQVEVPGLLDISGSGRLKGAGADISLERCLVQDLDLSTALPGSLLFPFRLKKLDLSGTRINGSVDTKAIKMSFPDTKLNLVAEALGLGPKGNEFYDGDLAVHLTGGPGPDVQLNGEAVLNRGQKILAKLEGSVMELNGRVWLENWSRGDLLAVLPRDARRALDSVPVLQGLSSAAIDIKTKFVNLELNCSVKPAFTPVEGAAAPVEIAMTSTGSLLALVSGGEFDTTFRAQVGDGSVSVATKLHSLRNPHAVVTFDQVDPARWVKTFSGLDALSAVNTRIGGTVELDAAKDLREVKVALNLKGSPFQVAGAPPAEDREFAMTGTVSAANSPPRWDITTPTLDLRLGDSLSLALRDFTIETEEYSSQGDVTAEWDLALLAPWMPDSAARGKVKAHLPLRHEHGLTSTTFDLAVENLGLGGFTALAGVPITAKGTAKYDNLNKKGEGSGIEVGLGPGTALTLASVTFAESPLRVEAPCAVKTDLQALVGMGILDSAKGTGTASGNVKYEDGRLTGNAEFSAQAESMTVMHGWAALNGVGFKGTVGYASDALLSGSGDVQIAQAKVAGASLQTVTGPIGFAGDAMKATGLTGKAFDGALAADVEVGLLRPGIPVRLAAQLSGVNLEMLTREMAPSSIKVTGPADGKLAVAMDRDGIKEFRLALQSKGPVTVNIGLLQQLLASEYVKAFKGKEQLERVMAEILGKEEQRPFDSAKLDLALQGDRFAGQITLLSPKLNLTVDLRIDVAAIVEALKMAQGK
jgi:hypothetical protein